MSYGYLCDPKYKQHLIIDEEAAEVVRRIYRLAIEGVGASAIARQLTDERVLIPSAYGRQEPARKRPQQGLHKPPYMVYHRRMLHTGKAGIHGAYRFGKEQRKDKSKTQAISL